ncbi:MAG: lysylphosphatidylglycerol synthase transmembrane domain-containing protein [Bacteroidota bacterium]
MWNKTTNSIALKKGKAKRSAPWQILLKGLLFLLLLYLIYRQLIARDNLTAMWMTFQQQLSWSQAPWLLAAILLMPLNWALETLKWQNLIRSFEPQMSFSRAYQAIFSGVTLSVFTPNRIGEYGGRILFVRPENNWKAVIATLVGSFSQLLVLLGMGLLGMTYFIGQYIGMEGYLLFGMLSLGALLIAVLFLCFYQIDLLIPLAKRLPFIDRLKPFARHILLLREYESATLSRVLKYAFFRYLVYATQYLLLMAFFGIELPWLAGLSGVATIFLLQTSIPLPPMIGLVSRGNIALFIWGMFSSNELAILAATFGLWILNLVIPALIGTVFMLNTNVLKSLGYEHWKT